MMCPKHNDPYKVYCETCSEVICRDCTISKEHKKHNFELISECYDKHHLQIQTKLDQLKHKKAGIDEAVTALLTREKEIVEKGENVKKEVHTHTQQLIDELKRSEIQLVQQVEAVVQQKRQILTKQREKAEKLHSQLEKLQERIESNLKKWSQRQVLTEKEILLKQMKIADHIQPMVFQPIEKADIKFNANASTIKKKIGQIESSKYEKAILSVSPMCQINVEKIATLDLHSQDGSPFLVPTSLISCRVSLSDDTDKTVRYNIHQTHEKQYNIMFTPCTRGDHQLIVQVGGIDKSGSPFSFSVKPSPQMRGEPIWIIPGLKGPMSVAVSNNGNAVVVEQGAHCVTVINKEGEKVRSFGTEGTNEGQFTYPHGVAISNDGHILVTDWHRLQKLTFSGNCVKSIGSSERGSGQLQFNYPKEIAVHPTTGEIFISDSVNNRIQVFNNDLSFIRTIKPVIFRSFKSPYGISLDSKGCLYVAECGNHCITKLTATGHYVTRFGMNQGPAPIQLCSPFSLTIHNNLIHVSETVNKCVAIFDTEGNFLHCYGKGENGVGSFDTPYGITTDTFGNLYVSDTYNNQIVVF